MGNQEELESIIKKFLTFIGIIIVVGAIMVLSSSYIYSREIHSNASHIFFKQLTFIGIGLVGCFILYRMKFNFWRKLVFSGHVFIVILMVLTLIPGLKHTVNGASRWINMGPIGVQPGELLKYSILLYSINYFDQFMTMTKNEKISKTLWLLSPLVVLAVQPDFGTFSICCLVMAFTCFLSNFPRKYFYSSIPVGIIIAGALLVSQPYRVRRLFAFLDPWKNPRGSGFQIIQSLFGFANGGIIGEGLGNSNEKLFYLPEAHNDFIFSVIGEELGFFGVILLVGLFLGFIYYGLKLATKIEDRFGSMIVSSVVFTIGLQAFLNMGVVLGLLPTKGLNLPFVSYGGTSMVVNCMAIGIILSIYRFQHRQSAPSHQPFDHFPSDRSSYYNGQRSGQQSTFGQRTEPTQDEQQNFPGF
ncbi:MAG: putative lipid II flippase FtsW [Bacteriovoracaceae bacterium]|nr:putative lipid II flippase FtsW [Bacteriovoracaceae bacterium]